MLFACFLEASVWRGVCQLTWRGSGLVQFLQMAYNEGVKRKPVSSRSKGRMFAPVSKTFSLVVRIIGSTVLLACIVVSLYIALVIARASPRLAVLLASATAGGFSFCLAIVSLPLLRKLVRSDEREMQDRIREQEELVDSLRKEKESLQEREVDFQRRIDLLEKLTVNMETYRDVFKVCFRDYRQGATIKRLESLNEQDGDSKLDKVLGRQGKSFDEVLSIMDCTVSYQRGVDLQKIRIRKVDDNSVVVSGISVEYLDMPRFDYRNFFNEIRRVKLDRNGDIRHITVEAGEYDGKDLCERQDGESYGKLLLERRNGYRAQFEKAFLNGKASDDSEEITKRAEDFIRIILQPVYAHVEFDESVPVSGPASKSLPLPDFLLNETKLYKTLLEGRHDLGKARDGGAFASAGTGRPAGGASVSAVASGQPLEAAEPEGAIASAGPAADVFAGNGILTEKDD